MIHTSYTCQKCHDEIPVEVILGEENDLPSECPNCGAAIPDSAHEEVESDAMGRAADSWEDDR